MTSEWVELETTVGIDQGWEMIAESELQQYERIHAYPILSIGRAEVILEVHF